LAEAQLRKTKGKPSPSSAAPQAVASATDVAPVLRGLLAVPADGGQGRWKRSVLAHRASPRVMDYVNGRELGRYSQQGPVTPDHVIRTKPLPLILPAPDAGALDRFTREARRAIEKYQADYRRYFERHNAKATPEKKPLDSMPRVVLVPGLGLFGVGAAADEARIAADVAETTVSVILNVEAGARFESISEREQFDMEYWSLEQAKLGKKVEKPLQGQVVAVTGGAGTIGLATAAAFKREGAEVALLDVDANDAASAGWKVGGLGLACDVTDQQSVDAAFKTISAAYGGVDIVVSNAGAAWQGRIGEVKDAVLRESFELNFFAHQYVAQAAVRVMLSQNTGGTLLFNASKQAVNPGPNFGPYGLPKAATLALMRQYAVEYGNAGITANAVNADRIRSGLMTDKMVKQRAKARGISEQDYLTDNLLRRQVGADDVAAAFVSLALARNTTGAILTVDGGNIAAAVR
jgi:NAD(P)-dependent dehydrogenase (short-subunit alcohol dehydrogenase family)